MHNTIDLSVGAHYKLNEQWLLRGSFKYEPTPTNGQFRDVNFPDGEKYGFQIGSRYHMSKQLALDLIYGHVFVKRSDIHAPYPQEVYPNQIAALGHTHTSIDLLGAQLVWNM
jgi:long-subunit fatty acid transport protein